MSKFKKTCKKMCEGDFKSFISFGPFYIRLMLLSSIVLLLLFSLVFHNFVIIIVILMLTLALAATFL